MQKAKNGFVFGKARPPRVSPDRTPPARQRLPVCAASGRAVLYLTRHRTDLVESPVVAVESEIAVEEACDVNLIRPPRSRLFALCMPAELILEDTTASSCSPKALRASPSSPPIPTQRRRGTLVCSTYVVASRASLPTASLSRTPRGLFTTRRTLDLVVRGRECVPDFCRDATYVYPRAPARATARRSDPRSRKSRPRSCAARKQYVRRHHPF